MDELDKRILREYQKDATVPYSALAEALGEAPTTVFNRVKRMINEGVIKAIVPIISDEALGLHATAWIQIGLDVDADCCRVAEELARNPRVVEVHEVAGEWDILAKVKAENNLGLHDLTKSLEIHGINRMSTIVVFKTVKENPGVEL